MALRLRIPGNARLTRILLHPLGRAALLVCLSLGVTTLAGFTYYYVKFAKLEPTAEECLRGIARAESMVRHTRPLRAVPSGAPAPTRAA